MPGSQQHSINPVAEGIHLLNELTSPMGWTDFLKSVGYWVARAGMKVPPTPSYLLYSLCRIMGYTRQTHLHTALFPIAFEVLEFPQYFSWQPLSKFSVTHHSTKIWRILILYKVDSDTSLICKCFSTSGSETESPLGLSTCSHLSQGTTALRSVCVPCWVGLLLLFTRYGASVHSVPSLALIFWKGYFDQEVPPGLKPNHT